MKEILVKLEQKQFTTNDINIAIRCILEGNASEAQIAAFLVLLEQVPKTPDILAAVAQASSSCKYNAYSCSDIVGTGGDGHNTFNVSTAASIIAAGAGCKIAKHGNRSSSSNCGSADILESMGVNLDKSTHEIQEYFSDYNFVFLFAQKWHPALKLVSKVRKELGIRTVFNILGPLINPFSPKFMVLGVYKKELGNLFAQTLLLLKVERAWVVHGCGGLDEISPEGSTLVWEVLDGKISSFEISPTDFGLSSHSLGQVKGSREENTRNMEDLLLGRIKDGPLLDFVLLNCSALLYVSGLATDLKNGVQVAKDSIYSLNAWKVFQEFKEFTLV